MESAQSSRRDWRTILTLGFSALGMVYFLIQALVLGGLWLSSLLTNSFDSAQNISYGLVLWSSLLSGFLLFPLFLLSLLQLQQKPVPAWLDPQNAAIRNWVMGLVSIWPLLVFLGWWVAGRPAVAAFLLGPINLLAAGLPVLWAFTAGHRKLEGGKPIRHWRILGFSLTVTPPIIIFVELLAVTFISVIIGFLLIYSISFDSQIKAVLNDLAYQIQAAGEDIELIRQLLEPYISQPAVIFWALVIFGGVVPVVEELIKPIAMWGLVTRDISPLEGFVGGLVCGAGFALTENILYLSMASTAQDWLILTVGRAGTGVMHMLASGLMGWGLARAWRDGAWGFLGLTSFAAFILHGLWNTLALVAGIGPLFLGGSERNFWQTILFNTPLIILFVLSLAGLMVINRYHRKKLEQESSLSAQNS